MALFLPVLASKKNKQTEKNISPIAICGVSQIHMNPEKTRKNHQNDFLECTHSV